MAFIFANPNPSCNLTGDCVIRAVSILTDQDWEETLMDDTMSEKERNAIKDCIMEIQ